MHLYAQQAKSDKLTIDLVGKLEEMKLLTVTQADEEAMEREVASTTRAVEDMGKEVEIKDKLAVSKHCVNDR